MIKEGAPRKPWSSVSCGAPDFRASGIYCCFRSRSFSPAFLFSCPRSCPCSGAFSCTFSFLGGAAFSFSVLGGAALWGFSN